MKESLRKESLMQERFQCANANATDSVNEQDEFVAGPRDIMLDQIVIQPPKKHANLDVRQVNDVLSTDALRVSYVHSVFVVHPA